MPVSLLPRGLASERRQPASQKDLDVRGMPKEAKMPSRTWSCGELAEGNEKLLKVKHEAEKEEDLRRKIEDRLCSFGFCHRCYRPSAGRSMKLKCRS